MPWMNSRSGEFSRYTLVDCCLILMDAGAVPASEIAAVWVVPPFEQVYGLVASVKPPHRHFQYGHTTRSLKGYVPCRG